MSGVEMKLNTQSVVCADDEFQSETCCGQVKLKYTKIELDRNPPGTNSRIAYQREREKCGRYLRADDKTMIFVGAGEDAEKKIASFLKRQKSKRRN